MFDPLDLIWNDTEIDAFVAMLTMDIEKSIAKASQDHLSDDERDLYCMNDTKDKKLRIESDNGRILGWGADSTFKVEFRTDSDEDREALIDAMC